MGIGVSTWRLARRAAQRGEIGVVSGTAIDAVVVRELQDGDPHDRRDVLQTYPDAEIADHLIDRFYQPEGRAEGEPYDPLPIHRFNPTTQSQRILAAATYTGVRMVKAGPDGLVGMNLMAKPKRYSLPCLYGALLAGVDIAFIGAGIPLEEARQIPKLAAGEPAALRLDVDTSQVDDPDRLQDAYTYTLDPSDVLEDPPSVEPPAFFPIISSDTLAGIMDAKLPDNRIDAWVIEGPVAGGYGSPEGLQYAQDVGTEGIQVGSLFSLTKESGYPRS